MIHPKAVAKAAGSHSLSNGSAIMASEHTKDRQKKVNFVTESKKFGFFHRQSKSNLTEPNTNKIYSISEEVSRKQAEERHEKDTELEEKALVVNCEFPSKGLMEEDTGTTDKHAKHETWDLDETASSDTQNSQVHSDPPTPKDALDSEKEFSSDSSVKQETVMQGNYITTRLWWVQAENDTNLYIYIANGFGQEGLFKIIRNTGNDSIQELQGKNL